MPKWKISFQSWFQQANAKVYFFSWNKKACYPLLHFDNNSARKKLYEKLQELSLESPQERRR